MNFVNMKYFKILYTYILVIIWLLGFMFAGDADRLVLQVGSNPVIIWEPVDFTIKVVDSNSDIVKTYYDKDIYMEIQWLKEADYTMPSDGIYTFQKNDQWIKIFSKWLTVKKEWEYKIKAYEVLNEKVLWEVFIKVTSRVDSSVAKITILSPTEWSTETENSVAVLWNSQFPNTPIKIYLDSKQVKTSITDPQWSFNLFLDSVWSGTHVLYIQAVDTDGNVLWKSSEIKFMRSGNNGAWYKNIYYSPGKIINQYDKLKISIDTQLSVSNSILALGDLGTFVMDKIAPWKFEKTIKANSVWSFPVSLKITNNNNDLIDANIDKITVNPSLDDGIKNIKIQRTSQNSVNLSRETNCNAAKYIVSYWDNKNNLTSSKSTTSKNISLDLSYKIDHYANIISMDAQDKIICKWSEIIKIPKSLNFDPTHGSASSNSCTIQSIKLTTSISNGKHFISWDKFVDIDKYIVYKSDSAVNSFDNMSLVWETSSTYFEIPYDNSSKNPIYTNYAVQAICKDWSKSSIINSTKIQVWVADNIIYVLMIVTIMYLWYRLAKN